MKKIQEKYQRGGLLIEALAILGIVAMTSPMVYKKKIDKAQELEDIAKASQIKIIREATNNYVDANYNKNDKISDKKVIGLAEMEDFLPPGFAADGNIQVGFKVADVDGNRRVNAIIVDGDEYNEKRGNRIAGLIGADGGYSNSTGTATGSNDVWSFNTDDFGITTNSQVVATTAFSKSAATGEYLYKYKIEGQPHVNMMMTNIDMGGNNPNRLGQDLNNVAHAGLKYGRDDTFNAWNLNGQNDNAQQFGDGSIGGRNRDGDVTTALQSSRTGATTGLNTVNPSFNEGVEGNAHGSGALTLVAKGGKGTGRGCTEALSRGDIGVGNDAGVFAACNNNSSRTAYLVAKGAMDGGEMRVRTNNEPDIGTTAYSNKSATTGATFDVTDGKGNLAASFNAERTDVTNALHFTNSNRGGTFSTMELKQAGEVKATGTADTTGGMLSLRDNAGNQSVRFTGEEALALTTVPATGHAGLTGDYVRDNQGTEIFSVKQTDPAVPNPRGEGAMFVRSTDDSATTAMIAGQSGGTSANLTLNRNGGVSRGARATSTDGGALYMVNSGGTSKVALEGDRKLGTITAGPAGSGYAEVRNNTAGTAAEMYSSVSGDLSGTSGSSGTVNDNATGGGAYIGYNAGERNVKFMGHSGYSSGSNTGGTLELTKGTIGTNKAIVTATMPAINDGGMSSSKTSSAMKLVQGGSYAQASADANYGGGEFALQNGGAIVANALSGSGSGTGVGGQLFITGTAKGATSGSVELHGSKNSSGQAVVRGSGTVTMQSTGVTATGKGGGTAGLTESQAYVRETGGSRTTGIVINGTNTTFYRPKDDADGYASKRSVYASGGAFTVGQNLTAIDPLADDIPPKGMSNYMKSAGGEGDIKGVILVRSNAVVNKISAPIVKTDGDMAFKDICIPGKTGTGVDSPCLLEAAEAEAGVKLELGNTLIGSYKTSQHGSKNSLNRFGGALWQLIASRIIDFYDSPAHNDTHHLKEAWGGTVKVAGDGIGFGSAAYQGKYGSSFKYLDSSAKFDFSGVKEDAAKGAPSGDKGIKLSYWNIESDSIEKLEKKYTYKVHSDELKTVVSSSEPTQYSAAGHGHGATDKSKNKGYYPVYKEGAGSYATKNTSVEGQTPDAKSWYAAMGHYHLNYECGRNEMYTVKKVKNGYFPSKKDGYREYDKTHECSNKKGLAFVQGSGLNIQKNEGKFTHNGQTRENPLPE